MFVISLGIGSPAAIPEFILFGLSPQPEVVLPDATGIYVQPRERSVHVAARSRTIYVQPRAVTVSVRDRS